MTEISTYRGDTELIDLTITDPSGTLDLTTATEIIFTVKLNKDDTTPLLTKTLSLTEITVTGALTCTIEIDAGDTQDIPGVFYYDVEVEVAGTIKTVCCDIIRIEREVTA